MEEFGRSLASDTPASPPEREPAAPQPPPETRPVPGQRGPNARSGGATWARLFGYDVFVSFALGPPPRGSKSYASDLVRKLREHGFTVFFSEDEAPVGEQLDPTLQRALHRSRVQVVVANRGTLAEPRWIRKEVESFRQRHPDRPIVPINIDGALQDPALADAADEWLRFRGRIWIDEGAAAAQEGVVSNEVIERLVSAPRAVRSLTWLRATVVGLVLFFAGLAAVATWQSVLATRESAVARREQLEALRQRDRALLTSLHNQVSIQLANGSLAQGLRFALAGQVQFPGSPMVRQTLMEVATHPDAVLLTIREPLDSHPDARFSSDGTRILSISQGLQSRLDARIRDLRGRELQSYASVRSAQFADGGRKLLIVRPGGMRATREADGSFCADADSQFLVSPPSDVSAAGPPAQEQSLAMGFQGLTPDGTGQLSVCGNFVHLRTLGGQSLSQWQVPGASAARLSPDGKRIAVVHGALTRLIALDAGPDDSGGIELQGIGPVFSDDSGTVATVAGGQTLLWNRSGAALGHFEGVAPVFGPGGALMTVAGASSRLWRPGGDPLVFDGTAPRMSGDGKWIMTTLGDGRTRVADAAGELLTVLDGGSADFLTQTPVVMTARADGLVQLWDLRRTPASSPGAARQIWGLADAEPVPWETPTASAAACPQGAACSPDGRLQVVPHLTPSSSVTPGAPFAAELRIRQVQPDQRANSASAPLPEEVPADPSHKCLAPLAPIAFSPAPDGLWVLGCGDGIVRMFDRQGVKRWEGRHNLAVTSAVFAPGGQQLLTTSDDRTARLWRVDTGAIIATLAEHESEVSGAAFAEQGQRLATLTTRGALRIWLRNGKDSTLLATISLADDTITQVAFSQNGDWLMARTRKGQLRRWLTRPDKLAKEYPWLDGASDEDLRMLGLR